jgi:hypothetical protein
VRFRRQGNRIYYSADDTHIGALFSEALHHLAHVAYNLPDHSALVSEPPTIHSPERRREQP